MSINKKNLIWIDLEMTGLDPKYDRIIEIATLVTDSNLRILAEGPVLAIYQSDINLGRMNAWNTKTHTESGLVERVKKSNFNEKKAEDETIIFLKSWVPNSTSPLCGNTVGQDRRFLFRYMPILESYFHYHYLDVSTIKELVCRWKPDLLSSFKKKNRHRAIDDIKESVAELSYYRDNFIKI